MDDVAVGHLHRLLNLRLHGLRSAAQRALQFGVA